MGILDSLFDSIKRVGPEPRDLTPNVANKVAEHLRAKWPELAGIPGLWFSGSQVHSIVRGVEPPAASDTDIFILKDAESVTTIGPFGATTRTPLAEMMARLGLADAAATPRQPPPERPDYHPNGMDIEHPRGQFDVWTAVATTVQGQLRAYPRSHSHCRAAFSFMDGLVVLPNEEAPSDIPPVTGTPGEVAF